jgi:hypothetical protein
LPPSVAATDGVQMLHLMLRAAGELASAVAANSLGTTDGGSKSIKWTLPHVSARAVSTYRFRWYLSFGAADAGLTFEPSIFPAVPWLVACVRISSAQTQHQAGTDGGQAAQRLGSARASPWLASGEMHPALDASVRAAAPQRAESGRIL